MSRLPQTGQDSGIWGDVLNDFLLQVHNADGTLKTGAVDDTILQDGSVIASKLSASSGSNGQVLMKNTGVSGGLEWANAASAPDATTSNKGIIQLAGDIAGTAASPTVPGLSTKVGKDELVINVKDHGASGNGTTDDTVAIAAALAALPGSKGIIFFPPGTYLTDSITLTTNQWLVGSGCGSTTLLLKTNATGPLVQSSGFASLTGTDTTSTPNNLGLRHMTLDGNKSAQTQARHGVAFYANGCRIEDVIIQSCKGWGIWTEWGTGTPAGIPLLESYITNFRVLSCDTGGIMHLGPHDTQILNGVIARCCTSTAGQIALDMPTDGRANGSVVSHLHIWGGTYDYGIRLASSGVRILDTQVEGGLVAQVRMSASITEILNCKLFAGGVNEATAKGLVIDSNASNVRARLKVENCGGAIVDVTGAGGNQDLEIHAQYYSVSGFPATPIIGSLPSGSRISLLAIPPSGVADPSTTMFVTPGSLSAAKAAFRVEATKGYVGVNIAPNTGIAALIKPNDGDKGISIAAANSSPDDLIQFTTSAFALLARVTGGGDIRTSKNMMVGTTTALDGNGTGVIGIANAASIPPSTPSGGGVLYVEGGALKFKGSSGTVTTIAPA